MKRAVLMYPPIMCLANPSLSRTRWYGSNVSPHRQVFAVAQPQYHVINATNPGGALDDSIEYRLHVRGGPTDNTEHLGCCRLMLQRLAQFRIALLKFFEQPHVLDGNDRLGGKRLEKFDLSICKRADFRATDGDRPYRNALPQQWRAEYGPSARLFSP